MLSDSADDLASTQNVMGRLTRPLAQSLWIASGDTHAFQVLTEETMSNVVACNQA